MKRFLHIGLWIIAGAIFLLLAGFSAVWINEWKPASRELVYSDSLPGQCLPDTIRVLTWNIGYAGLGYDMDFFMDGGKQVQTSPVRAEENLARIGQFLSASDADIILLQEVDRHSRRSYYTDQFTFFQSLLPDYHAFFCYNYKSAFAPVPLHSPVGRVEAGLAVFSKIRPREVVRYRYPGGYGFPVRLFHLKSCLMGLSFTGSGGKDVFIGNTHNTAYDTRGMRGQEMGWMREFLCSENGAVSAVLGGDWNQYPPGYTPSKEERRNPYFTPLAIPDGFFPAGWEFDYDPHIHSNRYLYEPLTVSTARTTLDFFLHSPGVECLRVEAVDLGFRVSDHNPVAASFVIK